MGVVGARSSPNRPIWIQARSAGDGPPVPIPSAQLLSYRIRVGPLRCCLPVLLVSFALVDPAAPLLASVLARPPQPPSPERMESGSWLAQAVGPLELKLRRLPDAVEVVVQNTGAAPQLLQTGRGASWLGQLQLAAPASLRLGPQQVALPEAGLSSVSLEGSGSSYRLEVTPLPGQPLGRPVVSADGRDLILTFNAPARATLQTGLVDRSQPGRLPQPSFVPSLRPRAVAPRWGTSPWGQCCCATPTW